MNKQLTLSIRLNDEATLNNFFWGEQTLVRQQLEYSLLHQGERFIYLWGSPASGKSHILSPRHYFKILLDSHTHNSYFLARYFLPKS